MKSSCHRIHAKMKMEMITMIKRMKVMTVVVMIKMETMVVKKKKMMIQR